MNHPIQDQSLSERFLQVRNQTEKLCQPLLPEDTVVQPIVDVSPPKWHLAHTSWFFETFRLTRRLYRVQPRQAPCRKANTWQFRKAFIP